jgi:hypothetical protein
MSIIVRKVTKKTLLSILGIVGLLLGLWGRVFHGNQRSSLEQLGQKADKFSISSRMINVANAEVVEGVSSGDSSSGDSSSGSGTGTDSSSDCDEGSCDSSEGTEGTEGTEGSEGEGEGEGEGT